MNDNDVIKALGNCLNHYTGCGNCPLRVEGHFCRNALLKQTLDLINRLQADKEALINGQETLQKYIAEQKAKIEKSNKEIKNLITDKENLTSDLTSAKAEIDRLQGVIDIFTDIGKLYSEIKSEARREFAERLKEDFDTYPDEEESMALYMINLIDNLLAEMNGKKDGEK